MRKRICIISPYAYPILVGSKDTQTAGGAEAQLSVLGRSLSEKGYEVHYIVDDFGQPSVEKVNDIWVHKAPLRYMGGANYHIIFDWLRFISVLWGINADIHLLKLPRNILSPLGAYCRLRCRRLVFIGQIDHDVDLDFIREHEGAVSYWLYRVGIKGVDFVVAQNETQREGFEKVFAKKTRVVKSLVTLPDIENVKKLNYVLWVGNSLDKKQPGKFIDLAENLPNLKFKMIVSPVDRERDEQLRTRAEGVTNLEYVGFVPMTEISRYYSKAPLFVSTSIREGFPNTFLQSWQYATPVVSLNIDPDGVIKKGNLGRVSGTMEQLCIDVAELMGDEGLLRECGINGKNYVEASHSKEVIVGKYLEILEELSNDAVVREDA